MGQRLVITIKNGEQLLANAYYHWSGYTGSALELTNETIKYLEDSPYDDLVRKAAYALFMTGARISPYETTDMIEEGINLDDFAFTFDEKEVNRNDGLLSLSKKGMEKSQYWSEGDVIIDLDDSSVDFGVFWACSVKEYKQEHEDDNFEEELDAMFKLSFESSYSSFDDFSWQTFYNEMSEACEYHCAAITPSGETIYEFIQ